MEDGRPARRAADPMSEYCRWWDVGYRWFCVRLWFRERPDKIAWWLANKLPRQVALYAFVRVYAACSDAPVPEYARVYQAWEAAVVPREAPPQ